MPIGDKLSSWRGRILDLVGIEPAVLAVLAMAVLLLLGFLKIAHEVREADPISLDRRILRALRRKEHPDRVIGPWWVGKAARDVTSLGSATVLAFVTLSVAGGLLLARRRVRAVLVLAATGSGALLSQMLKLFFARPRPELIPQLDTVRTASFPSGHSLVSAVVYLTIAVIVAQAVERKRMKFYILSVALLATFLVGVSRVLVGVHFPTDVVAGWLLGLAWALLWGLAIVWARSRRQAVGQPTETD